MPSTSTPSVLLVTESADEREMYAESFRRRGYCTLLASSVTDACRMATELPLAAVVTDARLAGPDDGLDLTRRLRQEMHLRDVPVVMVSGYPIAEARATAARAGCDAFVAKPCLPDTLSQLVAGLIEGRASTHLRQPV